MTNKELNRDIKKLWEKHEIMSLHSHEAYFKWVEEIAKKEYKRLYYADDTFEAMNLKSIKIMIRLNHSYRVVQPHQFGINTKIEHSAQPAAPQEPEEEGRKCNTCGNPMNEGYCIDGGTEYYCSEPCLHAKYSPEQWAEMYDDGKSDTYWTTWEE